MIESTQQSGSLISCVSLPNDVTQILTMEACDVAVRRAQFKLGEDVVTHLARRAGGEGSNWQRRESLSARN